MPVNVNLSDLISGVGTIGSGQGGAQAPFVMIGGKYVQNPSYLDPLQQQNLSTLVAGPTAGAVAGGAYQTAANEGARIAAQAAGNQNVPFTPSDLQNLINPQTGKEVPIGSTPASVQGQTFINSTDKQSLQELDAVQNLINQVKDASNQVNVYNGNIGSRNPYQILHGLVLKASGDPNAQFLDKGVKGLLGLVATGAAGVNRFNENEVNSLQENFPTSYDTKEVAQAKLQRVQKILDKKFQDLGVNPSNG